jgi:hypothetical protein
MMYVAPMAEQPTLIPKFVAALWQVHNGVEVDRRIEVTREEMVYLHELHVEPGRFDRELLLAWDDAHEDVPIPFEQIQWEVVVPEARGPMSLLPPPPPPPEIPRKADGSIDTRRWVNDAYANPAPMTPADGGTTSFELEEAELRALGWPARRLRRCVEAWPECASGEYNPSCCRFPKSCSCTSYASANVTEADLEPWTKPEAPRDVPHVVVAPWRRVVLEGTRIENWQSDINVSVGPMCLRECPACVALVADTDDAQEVHLAWHERLVEGLRSAEFGTLLR